MKTKWKLLTAIIWSVMIVLSFGALTASAAQSSLLCLVEPTEGAELKLYVYKRGEKTYLKKEDRKIGNYDVYEIEIPEIAGSGTTVYFEVKAASACYILDKLESDDIKIFKDERDIQQYKFTSSKDAGKVRHVRVLMKTNHYLTVVAKKEATCAVPGNNQNYKCSRCGKCFIDQNGTRATTEKEQQIISNKHTLTKTTKVDATCEKDGNKDYFKCTVCQKYFSDAEGSTEIAEADTVTEVQGHSLIKVEAKTPTHKTLGNIEYYKCSVCGELFLDAEGEQPATEDDVLLKRGWLLEDAEWYFYVGEDEHDKGTKLCNAWASDSVGWCWLDDEGRITKDKWIKDNGEWYYLKANGYMAANEWAKDNKGWLYMEASGKAAKAKWIQDKGSWYYLDASGYMVTGTQTINGKTYRFDSSGKWIK